MVWYGIFLVYLQLRERFYASQWRPLCFHFVLLSQCLSRASTDSCLSSASTDSSAWWAGVGEVSLLHTCCHGSITWPWVVLSSLVIFRLQFLLHVCDRTYAHFSSWSERSSDSWSSDAGDALITRRWSACFFRWITACRRLIHGSLPLSSESESVSTNTQHHFINKCVSIIITIISFWQQLKTVLHRLILCQSLSCLNSLYKLSTYNPQEVFFWQQRHSNQYLFRYVVVVLLF